MDWYTDTNGRTEKAAVPHYIRDGANSDLKALVLPKRQRHLKFCLGFVLILK